MMEIILAQAVRAVHVMSVEAIVILIIFVAFLVLVISCLLRISRYFRNAGNEQKLLRLELGKLAEEMHQIREKMSSTDPK
jgi:hypothetical protein